MVVILGDNNFRISISIFITLGRNAFVISFSNALNTISGFWHFPAPFTNIINNAAINSFIFNNTGITFDKIIKP